MMGRKEQHHKASGRNVKKWNGMNGGKLDLERERLQEMLEQSCWIINNERISLMWA